MNTNESIDLAECGYYPNDDGELDYTEWSDFRAFNIMSEYLKYSYGYLVFARGCRWNGGSGYKLVKDYVGVISRSYDFSLVPIARSRGKKVLVCRESSHDVSMGSTTIIVALTEKEYEKLDDSGFPYVREFAESMERKVS